MPRRHASKVIPDRRSSAPYNFVPLPELAPPTLDGRTTAPLPPSEQALAFDPQRLSGTITYIARTLSPTYTRAAVPPESANEEAGRDFFHHGDPAVAILPGSGIRGMIKALHRVATGSKLGRTKRRRLFIRSFAGGVMGTVYGDRVIERLGRTNRWNQLRAKDGQLPTYRTRTEAGFLRLNPSAPANQRWTIMPCDHLRIRNDGLQEAYTKKGKTTFPDYHKLQHRDVWVELDASDPSQDPRQPRFHTHRDRNGNPGMYTIRARAKSWAFTESPGRTKGALVIGGQINKKRTEAVFLPDPSAKSIDVPDDVIAELEDADQITKWQELAFPSESQPGSIDRSRAMGAPSGKSPGTNDENGDERPKRDDLRTIVREHGYPVWFLRDDSDKVIGIGRAWHFRLRHEYYTEDFMPTWLRESEPSVDPTERLFGRVRVSRTDDEDARTPATDMIRGRVRFLDAVCDSSNPFLDPLPGQKKGDRIPLILSSPKPTAFQHMLNQPPAATGPRPSATGHTDPRELSLIHYSMNPAAGKDDHRLRGFKFYWHRNTEAEGKRVALADREIFKNGLDLTTQDTIIRPVRANITFRGEIRFDNVTPAELGSLLTVIDLPAGCAHRFGMGKPHGMGSVRMESIQVTFIDRCERYTDWGASGRRSDPQLEQEARNAFAMAMLGQLQSSGDMPPADVNLGVWDLPRMTTLRMLLDWDNAPPSTDTRYIGLDGQDAAIWKRRAVLPAPHDVLGKPDPFNGYAIGDGGSSRAPTKPPSSGASTSVTRHGAGPTSVATEERWPECGLSFEAGQGLVTARSNDDRVAHATVKAARLYELLAIGPNPSKGKRKNALQAASATVIRSSSEWRIVRINDRPIDEATAPQGSGEGPPPQPDDGGPPPNGTSSTNDAPASAKTGGRSTTATCSAAEKPTEAPFDSLAAGVHDIKLVSGRSISRDDANTSERMWVLEWEATNEQGARLNVRWIGDPRHREPGQPSSTSVEPRPDEEQEAADELLAIEDALDSFARNGRRALVVSAGDGTPAVILAWLETQVRPDELVEVIVRSDPDPDMPNETLELAMAPAPGAVEPGPSVSVRGEFPSWLPAPATGNRFWVRADAPFLTDALGRPENQEPLRAVWAYDRFLP